MMIEGSSVLHRMRRNFLLFLAALFAVLLLAGCPKKPPMEAGDVNRMLASVKEKCAAVYAPDDLGKIQPLVDQMNVLAEKGKKKRSREKALAVKPLLQNVEEALANEKETLRKEFEAGKFRAEEALREAEEERGLICAENFIREAKGLLAQAAEIQAASSCRYSEVFELLRRSAGASRQARERAIAERERIQREEEERRRLEAMKEIPPPPKEETKSWTVQKGESLWKISSDGEIYGDPFLWPLIFWANRSQIKEPGLIYEGQNLKIPRNCTKEEMEKAVQRAKSGTESGLNPFLNGK